MRGVLRWAVRQPRVWLSAAAALTAVALTFGDGRIRWTALASLFSVSLLGWAIWAQYVADHPDHAVRRAAKDQAEVDGILWKYERGRAARERERERERH